MTTKKKNEKYEIKDDGVNAYMKEFGSDEWIKLCSHSKTKDMTDLQKKERRAYFRCYQRMRQKQESKESKLPKFIVNHRKTARDAVPTSVA